MRFDIPTHERTFRAIVVSFSAVSSFVSMSYCWRPKDTDGKFTPAQFWFGRQAVRDNVGTVFVSAYI